MRFIIMHKTNREWETNENQKVTPEEAKVIGEMIGELKSSGAMLSGEGLGRSVKGARVKLTHGDRTVTPGPFSGEGALPARFAMFRAESVDQAADFATRFGRIFGDVVVDVRPLNEAWDLGFAPKPPGLKTQRFMAVVNANAASEAGAPLSSEQKSALKAFSEELGRSGAFISIEHCEPSSKGKRLRGRGRPMKHDVLDGPFVETKELIGGFVIVDVPSIDDAVRIAQRYVEAVPVEELDVRRLV